VFNSLAFENLYVRSSDCREISFGPNSFYGNVELILAAEPEIKIQEFRTEFLMYEECGQDISINFPKNDAMDESDARNKTLLMLMNDNGNIFISLRQEYINFLEKLLNGEYCSHSFRKGNILGNTLGSCAIYDFR
jgi:hypothetical protein